MTPETVRRKPVTRPGQRSRHLRKQPKVRRMNVAHSAALPPVTVPRTARKRRWRNRRFFHFPTRAVKRVVTSSRWISLSLVAVCAYALALIGQYEAFYLRLVPVTGAVTISPSEIVAASGLANTHVFAADPNEAATRVSQLPGVVSATVTLEWPSQVSVAVVENSPIAIWQQAGEQFWVDKEGNLIPSRVETTGLLVIESELDQPVGELTFVPKAVLAGALQLRELRPNIDRLYYRPSGGLSYQDGRGWRVYFGVGTDMPQKLAVYESVVENLQTRGLTPQYISVSNQEKPYYKALNQEQS